MPHPLYPASMASTIDYARRPVNGRQSAWRAHDPVQSLIVIGDPLNGTVGDDFIFANEFLTDAHSRAKGNGGDDLIVGDMSGFQGFTGILNIDFASATPLGEGGGGWSIDENPLVGFSTTIPHISVYITGTAGQKEYFSYAIGDSGVTFDLDFGLGVIGGNANLKMTIYREILSQPGQYFPFITNDNSLSALGGLGSLSEFDPYISVGNLANETIMLVIERATASGTLDGSEFFMLNISDASRTPDAPSAMGDDELFGNEGADMLLGQGGDDTLDGDDGVDTLHAGLGNDLVYGGDDFDSVRGEDGNDSLYGQAGDDLLQGQAGDDWIDGGSGNDRIVGLTGDDTVFGGVGNDTLIGGTGAETLDGGDDDDWVAYDASQARVRADLQIPASNTGEASGDSYIGIENLRGSNFADVLRGDSAANVLEGGSKNDALRGRGGDDTLIGGTGFDRLEGQGGADHFVLSKTAPDADIIEDFVGGTDKLSLDGGLFGLTPGALDSDAFIAANSAQDAEDRLIYRAATGKLYYDPDGAGAAAQVLIATLETAPTLAASDFIVT